MLRLKSGAKNAAQRGATLLEVLLVLAIGASILYMSIQQYLSYKRDGDALVVKANVDAIFQAMDAYYRENCYGRAPGGVLNAGVLNPLISSTIPRPNPSYVKIDSELRGSGFLTKVLQINPLVDEKSFSNGYIAQYNESITNRQVCMDAACTPSLIKNVGQIITWKAQVAVKLKDTANAKVYKNLLGGDCLSVLAGAIVKPCGVTSKGDYVVWERLPNTSNTGALSTYWGTTPTVRQFTQMYRVPPLDKVIGNATLQDNTYFLCGN